MWLKLWAMIATVHIICPCVIFYVCCMDFQMSVSVQCTHVRSHVFGGIRRWSSCNKPAYIGFFPATPFWMADAGFGFSLCVYFWWAWAVACWLGWKADDSFDSLAFKKFCCYQMLDGITMYSNYVYMYTCLNFC